MSLTEEGPFTLSLMCFLFACLSNLTHDHSSPKQIAQAILNQGTKKYEMEEEEEEA